jgi:hypothetical protein
VIIKDPAPNYIPFERLYKINRDAHYVQHSLGHKDTRMTLRYAHLLPDDLKEAFAAIDNTGTASILSQIYHNDEKEEIAKAVSA